MGNAINDSQCKKSCFVQNGRFQEATTSSLYNDQFNSKSLADKVNLLAIELLGHGATSYPSERFTYWDSAIMAVQVMEDPKTQLGPFYDKWSVPTRDFVVDEEWRGMVAGLGFSGVVSPETLSFWNQTLKEVYSGDEGQKKLRMALTNLMERNSLLCRLRDVRCPVYWLQGPEDPVFGKFMPAEHIKLFTGPKRH
ncbi:Alpha/Beta hydrolase protein [Penicillium daleae]|uniref:Alpha/Beta hydrolase protein n=1 Tax=Penicillium daleae TaxID=63821 RepID=A0AAD6BXS6_9EURO|nr:Alpha/Beta hydrolase protein [Penicillium daleae]KAJ5438375.1 Alpha/Beta hydrolase protein [Penicillium daleae]